MLLFCYRYLLLKLSNKMCFLVVDEGEELTNIRSYCMCRIQKKTVNEKNREIFFFYIFLKVHLCNFTRKVQTYFRSSSIISAFFWWRGLSRYSYNLGKRSPTTVCYFHVNDDKLFGSGTFLHLRFRAIHIIIFLYNSIAFKASQPVEFL